MAFVNTVSPSAQKVLEKPQERHAVRGECRSAAREGKEPATPVFSDATAHTALGTCDQLIGIQGEPIQATGAIETWSVIDVVEIVSIAAEPGMRWDVSFDRDIHDVSDALALTVDDASFDVVLLFGPSVT